MCVKYIITEINACRVAGYFPEFPTLVSAAGNGGINAGVGLNKSLNRLTFHRNTPHHGTRCPKNGANSARSALNLLFMTTLDLKFFKINSLRDTIEG